MREKSRESEKSKERGRERDMSEERVRERSPLVRREGTSQEQPHGHSGHEQGLLGEVLSSIPRSLEIQRDGIHTAQATGHEHLVTPEQLQGEKLQKLQGSFSGEEILKKRVEEWMVVDSDSNPAQHQPLSYRDAVKPRGSNNGGTKTSDDKDDDWDGTLCGLREVDMRDGVTVTDSPMGPLIEFSKQERERLEKRWSRALIIKLLGASMGFMQMKKKVQQMWGKLGKVELSDIGNDYMIASFSDIDDYYFALEGGPWTIFNHYLTVQTWKRNFNPRVAQIRHLAIWVRLPGLPGDYYDKNFFYHLGNQIGKAIKVDEMTFLRERTMYARMCVEIDLSKPLLPSYSVDGNQFKIEYEGLHMICFKCGKFGHTETQRPLNLSMSENRSNSSSGAGQPAGNNEVPPTPVSGPKSVYGEWMVAQYPRKGKRNVGQDSNRKEVTGKAGVGDHVGPSRFSVLELEDENLETRAATTTRDPLKDVSNVSMVQQKKSQRKGPVNSKGKGGENKSTGGGELKRKAPASLGKEKSVLQRDMVMGQESDIRLTEGANKGTEVDQASRTMEPKEQNRVIQQGVQSGPSEEHMMSVDNGPEAQQQMHLTHDGLIGPMHDPGPTANMVRQAEASRVCPNKPPDPFPECHSGEPGVKVSLTQAQIEEDRGAAQPNVPRQ